MGGLRSCQTSVSTAYSRSSGNESGLLPAQGKGAHSGRKRIMCLWASLHFFILFMGLLSTSSPPRWCSPTHRILGYPALQRHLQAQLHRVHGVLHPSWGPVHLCTHTCSLGRGSWYPASLCSRAELPTKPQPGPPEPVTGPALSVVPFEPVVSTPPSPFLVSASPSPAKPSVSVASTSVSRVLHQRWGTWGRSPITGHAADLKTSSVSGITTAPLSNFIPAESLSSFKFWTLVFQIFFCSSLSLGLMLVILFLRQVCVSWVSVSVFVWFPVLFS